MYELQDQGLQIYASKNIDPASRKLLLCSIHGLIVITHVYTAAGFCHFAHGAK